MKRIIISLALLVTVAISLSAQTMQNVGARRTQSLDGEWKSIIDPYGHGNWSYWQDWDFDGTLLQDYDFETSPELKVPGDWNTQRPELYYYEGNMWYRKRFVLNDLNARLFLHFDAANYKTKVWLNGKEIGEHEGGYTPFEFDVTDKVKREGENSLVVRVNNERLPDGIPTMNTDWWNFGGLTRSVCLVEVQPTYIYDYNLSLTLPSREGIEGFVLLRGENVANQKVNISIPDLKINKTFTSDSDGRIRFTLKAKPKLWSPETPTLYNVSLTLNGETLRDQIGFRTITTEGDKILLNGKPVFLAGVNIHEETFGDSRRATTLEDDSLLLQAAKDLGCNFVRLAHYPHNEDMVRLADRMGLMVWDEIPLYWGIDWRNERTYNLAVQQLTEMIARDRNRASVIIWSIANETAVNNERTAFLTRLAGEARRQDGTRLISAALQNVNKQLARNVYTVEDPLHEALDLFSFNEYIGWYDNVKEACDSITWVLPEGKPIVISEFGGGAKIGLHCDAGIFSGERNPDAFFSEENLASLYRHQFAMLRKINGLAGTIPWVLKDFRSPHRMLPGVQDDFNRKGLLSEKGEKKQAWQIVHDWNVERVKEAGARAAIIRNAAEVEGNQWICFRKTINIAEGDPSQATLRIAADSKYWLWVNGELEVFEGQLKRGPNASDSYIDVVHPKHLCKGENSIAVLVWYFGKEGFSHKNSPCPGLYFDLAVGGKHFESDATWRTVLHPAYYTPSGEAPNWRLAESNVGFDARKDMAGWEQPGYDDSRWERALTVPAEQSGWGGFVERPIPQWKDYGVRSYVSQEKNGCTVTCTLPYNAQVTPVLTVRAKAGSVIGIQTDDYKPTGENSVRAEYITKEGEQTYESLGWMNGHRVIYTIPEDVEILSLGYRETGYDCEFVGSFRCDDARLNRLWEMSQRTLYLTMRDNFMDCPDRERAQWIGDFAIELEVIFYSLSPRANLLSAKCLREFAAWQREDGTLHAPVPAGNYDEELPQQCLAAMGWGAWQYYLGTADRQTIKDVFPAWKRYMHIWQMDDSGLVVYRRGGWDWGDWGTNQDMQALCQFWYSVALDYYARQAELIGEADEAKWARSLNESLKAAIHQNLWAGDAYRHPSYTGAADDRTQAMAVLSAVAPQSEYGTLRQKLLDTQFASPYMERFVLEALCQMGCVDDAVQRMSSRYQPMVDSPYSTLWELFQLDGGTYNHAWSGAPLIILSKYVAGVQPLEPGFKRFLVRPQLGSLQFAEAVVPSVNGDIVVKVTQEDGLRIDITVPKGTKATLSIPVRYSDITLNGKAKRFKATADGKWQEYEVKAGRYILIAN